MTPRLPLNQAIDRGNKLVHLLNSPNFAHLIKVPNFCVKFPLEDEICDIPRSGSGRLGRFNTGRPSVIRFGLGSNRLISALEQNMGCGLGKGIGIPGPRVPP